MHHLLTNLSVLFQDSASAKDSAYFARPQLVTALLDTYVIWCGAGSSFSACIGLKRDAPNRSSDNVNNNAAKKKKGKGKNKHGSHGGANGGVPEKKIMGDARAMVSLV
jgi:hypothetical protein